MESAKRIWTSQTHNNIPLNPYWTQGDVVMAGNGFLFVRAKIKILNLVALSFLGTESIRNASRVSQNIQTGTILDAIHGNKPCFVFFHPAQTSDKNRDIFLDFLAGLA